MSKKECTPHGCDDLAKCLGAIDKEIANFKECGFTKHVNHVTKEKILFCLILRNIAEINKKLDRILCELNSDWDDWSDSCNCKNENDTDDTPCHRPTPKPSCKDLL